MEKVKVGIIGAGGYGGCGAIELLLEHPQAEVAALIDKQDVGRPISDLYPHLKGFCDLPIMDPDDPDRPDHFDILFFATPDGVGQKEAPAWLDKGTKVVDYSGDFRFNDPETYRGYAARIDRTEGHASPDLLPGSVYGLAELHREEIAKSNLVGNPGCFAVSCILGLSPAVKAGLVDLGSLICDCKTGVSGAGKKPSPTFHYPARYDQMNAYKLAGHQHVCEIERELGLQAGTDVTVTFTAQVVPACRGIMSTLYANLQKPMTEQDVMDVYRAFYPVGGFVRLYESTAAVGTAHVRGTNYANLVVSVDSRTNRLRVVSYIDNLVKGQAGSALQNMNRLFGLPETTGLDRPGRCP